MKKEKILEQLIDTLDNINNIIKDDLDLTYSYNDEKREILGLDDDDNYFEYLGKLYTYVDELKDYCSSLTSDKMYVLDIKNSRIDYATETARKYFKIAVDYAIKNGFDNVKINRTMFIFDFDNLQVKIGTSTDDLTTYKIKEV